ncbi:MULTISPECIES: hypothetical protein [Bifidobacterium]|nr:MULTISPECIES: hypothetical protein [Bifidobacterium]
MSERLKIAIAVGSTAAVAGLAASLITMLLLRKSGESSRDIG